MKRPQIILAGVIVFLGFFFILRAQEADTAVSIQVEPLSLTGRDVAAFSALSEAQLAALVSSLEATPVIPFANLSSAQTIGTFYSLQNPDWPALPADIRGSDVWPMSNGSYLLNDVTVNYQTPVTRSLAVGGMQAMTESLPSPDDGGDGSGTNLLTSNALLSPASFGTNLWLAQVDIASGQLMAIASNTLADVPYEIQSLTNLTQANWYSEGFIYGSETTNWTPLSVTQGNRTNLFLRLRSWASSDGSGLPDWWELQYFGHLGVDPNGDPDGDGWSNWQEFENGSNPTNFDYPQIPSGTAIAINPINSTVTIKWPSVNGAVVSYTVVRIDYSTAGFGPVTNTVFNVGLTNQFVDTNFPTFNEDAFQFITPSVYQVQANYANGTSAFLAYNTSPYPSSDAPSVLKMAGAGNATALLVTHIPPGVSSIELERSDLMTGNYSPLTGLPCPTLLTSSAYAIYPVGNFTNGAFVVPTNMIYTAPYGSYFHLLAIWPDGSKSSIVDAGTPETPFYDGRTQLVQNVSFLLRAASLTSPFSYVLDATSFQVNQPTNYTYASYYDAYTDGGGNYYSGLGDYSFQDWQRPFVDNYIYRNFLYGNNTNLDSSGFLNTGCALDGGGNYSLSANPVFLFAPPTNGLGIPNLGQPAYAQPYADYTQLGISVNGSSRFVLPTSIYNYFGLHLSSVLIAHNHAGTLYLDTLSAGGTWPATNDTYYFYPQFDQPQLQTVGYYFGRIDSSSTAYEQNNPPVDDPMPGNSNFSPNAPQPLIIVGMDGWPVHLAAFAKQTVVNGDTSKPVYVAQYFDTAYKVDASGNVTSTQTGVLSPKGDFFPTEPGAVALVTMPDINTGQRGTNIIYVMSLALDANHDGVMDLSYFGGDQVSSSDNRNFFKFWANNGYIKPGANGNLDQDLPVYPNQTGYANSNLQPNNLYGQITCQRDLENFARLWVCGLPQFPANKGYRVSLGFDYCYGAGVNLYPACETSGGTAYLTDTNVAAAQLLTGYVNGHSVDFGGELAQVGGYYDLNLQDYALPLDSSGNAWLTNFLFEGGHIGSGNLILTVFQSNNIIAQATANMNIDDIKNYYEQAAITNVVQTWPEMVQTNLTSGFQIRSTSPYYSSYDAKQEAVFVHGWRMTEFDYEDFSDTMFKRLYWQGFQGRFASLRWPTRSTDTDTNTILGIPADMITFDRSEHIAFMSGSGAAAYFNDLRQRFPDYTISSAAHSMGNIVMMQALKELAASSQAPLDNYVMMQAAVAAKCYDTSLPDLAKFTNQEQILATPNTYSGYAGSIDSALRGALVNFFNTNDYALATASTNVSVPLFGGYYISTTIGTSWEDNQLLTKPLFWFGYSYNPTNSTAYLTNVSQGVTGRTVTDPRELMPFVARTRTKAVGAQIGVGQMVNGGELNLSPLGFSDQSFDHSGQFTRNIQMPQVQIFYTNLVLKLFP